MVLIAGIEDDPGIAEVLVLSFLEAGWEWRCLPAGPQVLGALREFRPDVVTTRARHPTLPGVRFLDAMKRDPELLKIPMVFVTALDRENLWESMWKIGRDPDSEVAGYVWKPFVPAELVADLRRVLDSTGGVPGVGA